MNTVTARDFIRKQDRVYALSRNFFAIYDALTDPDKSFRDIGRIIGCDAGFSARLLKIVNSPFFGFERKIESLDHAIALVGTEPLADLLFSMSVIQNFRGVPHDLFNEDQFWRHSVACGVLAKRLAMRMGCDRPGRFYLVGLLHDMGRILLCVREPSAVSAILTQQAAEGQDLCLLEREQFGFDHAELGAVLFETWKLPPMHAEATRYHHRPEEAGEYRDDARIVAMADYLCHEMEFSPDMESGNRRVPDEYWVHLDLIPEMVPSIKKQVQPEFDFLLELVV
ncbi:putative HD domain protein [Nitrospina gracilis 3/211]|uniref:Putative HD domain protein n=1 Tax=Nitrospina gracilis (strain 3/211) TaxID=1266370 RepID=M1ZA05_NITG3|nr:HDOD domain-containing protein [Nitrospina gracilis]MCF8723012.1 HD-like signal output (HDOD) protein [Nitrospina sp. Nb-3]CCQ90037.1 putative HD domain protein [Nitrospina gracilis 3/211]